MLCFFLLMGMSTQAQEVAKACVSKSADKTACAPACAKAKVATTADVASIPAAQFVSTEVPVQASPSCNIQQCDPADCPLWCRLICPVICAGQSAAVTDDDKTSGVSPGHVHASLNAKKQQ